METSQIKIGTRIVANKLTMIVTGETQKYFKGYHEHNGKKNDCTIYKETFSNPHYMNNIKILN